MKKNYLSNSPQFQHLLILVGLITLIGGKGFPAYAQNSNEYNFEDITKWAVYSSGNLALSTVDDPAATDSTAIKIATLVPVENWWQSAAYTKEGASVPEVNGNQYTISFRYRVDETRPIFLSVISRPVGTSGSADSVYLVRSLPSATTDYRAFTYTFTSGATVPSTVHVQVRVGGNETPVYLDDIKITETEPQVPVVCNEKRFNKPGYWEAYGGVTFSQVADPNAECETALELVPTEIKPQWYGAAFRVKKDSAIADVEGKKYRASFRYRAPVPRQIAINVTSSNKADRATLATYQFSFQQANADYKNYALTFTSLATAESPDAYVSLVIGLGDAADPVYIDNVVIEELIQTRTEPTTVYVNPAIGSDNNDGFSNTPAGAWKSIAYALTAIIPGDSLLLADGLYAEGPLTLNGAIATAERPTVIKSINKWGAKLQDNTNFEDVLSIINSEYVVIDGIEAFNPGAGEDAKSNVGVDVKRSNYVTIQNVYAHDCGCAGISAREGDYITIQDNIARDNAKISPYNCSGISVFQPIQKDSLPGYHIIIRRNVAFENECRVPFIPRGLSYPTDGNGIILDDFYQTQSTGVPPFQAPTLVENNLTFNNGGNGIKVYQSERVMVRNNTAWHNNYVLSERGKFWGEITFQSLHKQNDLVNNVIVQKFGQPGHGFTNFNVVEGMTLAYQNNLIVGTPRIDEPSSIIESGNKVVSIDRQSFPQFAQATTEVVFDDIDDFKTYFALRSTSPGIDAGLDEKAAATGRNGTIRPQGVASDIGAYEGSVEGVGPLPEDKLLVAEIPSATVPIVVDGTQEGFYTGIPQGPSRILLNELDNEGDLSAKWTAVWDEDNLYVFAIIEDDVTGSGNADALSVFIDGNNDKGQTYDENDGQFTLNYDGTTSANFAGSILATATGYNAEVAIPWSLIGITPSDSLRIGLDLIVDDDDNADGTVDHQLAWQAGRTGAKTNPSLFGEGLLLVVAPPPLIAATDKAITIDGTAEATWNEVTMYAIAKQIQPGITSDADLSGQWRAQWDEQNLYFFVSVTDDDKQNDSPNWYNDDGVEIYLDADNSKDVDYGSNDYQIIVEYNGEDIYDTKNNLGPGATARVVDTDSGYNVEVALPWTALKATPAAGLFLGLDVHIIDDDEGGNNDGKLAWFTNVDDSYRNTALFGSVVLLKNEKTLFSVGDCVFTSADFPESQEIIAVNPVTYADFSRNKSAYVIGIATGIREDGLAGAWEIHSDCSVKTIRRTGQGDNTTRLPDVRGLERNRGWKYIPNAISEDGQYIYATAINEEGFTHARGWTIKAGTAVDIRWKLGSPFYGRIFGINGEILCDDLEVKTYASNYFVTQCNDEASSARASAAPGKEVVLSPATISIYPNPTRGTVQLRLPDADQTQIEVLDIQGRTVRSHHYTNTGQCTLDLQGLPEGLYLIRARANGLEFQERVILEK